jgi:hypothetical protein
MTNIFDLAHMFFQKLDSVITLNLRRAPLCASPTGILVELSQLCMTMFQSANTFTRLIVPTIIPLKPSPS